MKGDFSRITGLKAKRKHYSGLLKQQGRVQLDSDWNELISIIAHQRSIRTIDTIGPCGAPIHDSGFEILHPGGGLLPNELLITTGRFYSGGLLCETTPNSKLPISGFQTANPNRVLLDDTKIDGVGLAIGQWVQLITDEQPDGIIAEVTALGVGTITLSQNVSAFAGDHHPFLRRLLLYSQQSDYPSAGAFASVAGQTDLLYLDVWERHITIIEDPSLREVALGGPDTDTRSKIIAQVKILTDVGDVECGDDITKWNSLTKIANGRLTTRPVAVVAPTNPCQLGESGGFLGLENRLYRVEIHDPGVLPGSVPTFKWSRDNASYAYPVQDFFDVGGGVYKKIILSQNGKDEILKIKELDWIEVSEDTSDLSEDSRGTLAQVLKVDGNILTLDTNVAVHRNRLFPKIRRWDISNQRPDKLTNIVTGTGLQLEDGIEIEFSGTEFKTGDYWCFSARTLTGEIEILDKEAPLGVKHHYCRLGLVTGLAGGEMDIEDCRPEFPPLTELPKGGGCCTITVGEGEEFQDIQLAVDALNGGPGTVCIKPGVYMIDKPISVAGSDITIKGCEGKPIIINTGIKPEESIIFQVRNSWDIDIHDLWCISTSGEGAKVIEVQNCLFFTLHDCLLIGAGTNDFNGVISCRGLTINSSINDNLILGRIGIRYDSSKEQNLNLNLNPSIVQNIIFALENGIFQADNTVMAGLDIDDNLLLGINKKFLGRAFFPKSLSAFATEKGLYAGEKMTGVFAQEEQSFESIDKRNTSSVVGLEAYMKLAANESRSGKAISISDTAATMAAVTDVERTLGHVIQLAGSALDVNITDNIIFGGAGIFSNSVIECTIDRNIMLTQREGIELGLFQGVTIDNNLIVSGHNAIVFFGQICQGFTVLNNRITTPKAGVISLRREKDVHVQLAYNIQLEKNIINATEIGINLDNQTLFLMDLTIVDNSITGGAGIAIFSNTTSELLQQLEQRSGMQRIIQRNSISVTGLGIYLGIPYCQVLDNVINIIGSKQQQPGNSWGIWLQAHKCSIVNNVISGLVDVQNKVLQNGGIFIGIKEGLLDNEQHSIDIVRNTIVGGAQNGIEIASDINGLVIEGNEIVNMILSGIVVQEHVRFVNNLRIAGNHIHDCFTPLPADQWPSWWNNAAIVLTSTKKTQIIGNRIINNGRHVTEDSKVVGYGAFYAEQVDEIQILDNQFIDNWVMDKRESKQAIIHVLRRFYSKSSDDFPLNADIQILNNIVNGANTRALVIGNVVKGDKAFALDSKAVIGNNHFETTLQGPIVEIHISKSLFSNNFVSCAESSSSVSLGFGWRVMANGNVVSAPITGAGFDQQIINTLLF
jgi:hypothetical protein